MAIDDFLQKMTLAERKAWFRKVMGPDMRRLEGEELNHIWLILQFMEPFDSTNNQQWCTDKFEYNSDIYHVHYINEIPMIEVELKDDEDPT